MEPEIHSHQQEANKPTPHTRLHTPQGPSFHRLPPTPTLDAPTRSDEVVCFRRPSQDPNAAQETEGHVCRVVPHKDSPG